MQSKRILDTVSRGTHRLEVLYEWQADSGIEYTYIEKYSKQAILYMLYVVPADLPDRKLLREWWIDRMGPRLVYDYQRPEILYTARRTQIDISIDDIAQELFMGKLRGSE